MDLLSHALLGAAIGEATVGRRIGRRGMAMGAVTALLPDLDVLGHFFLPHAQQLAFHRGITHSLLVAAILPLILAWLIRRNKTNATVPYPQWTILFGLALLSHLLLDVLTCYGTGLFEPFHSARIAFDTIFVADPFYTLPLLICTIGVLRTYSKEATRRKWNLTGLFLSGLYLLFTFVGHLSVQRIMTNSLVAQGKNFTSFTVTPTPMNSLLWMGYSQDKTGVWIGYYSLLDADTDVKFHRLERNDSLLAAFESAPTLAVLKRLSKGNYALTQQGEHIYFNDLRFGQVADWDSLDSEFALRYDFAAGADNARPLNRTRFTESKGVVFWRLVDRILGK